MLRGSPLGQMATSATECVIRCATAADPRACFERCIGGGGGGGGGDLVEGVIRRVLSSVEVRSAYTPPYRITVDELLAGGGGEKPDAAAILKRIKPTVLVRGDLIGARTIAPGGTAAPDEWRGNAWRLALVGGGVLTAVGLVLTGLGFWIGRATARRST